MFPFCPSTLFRWHFVKMFRIASNLTQNVFIREFLQRSFLNPSAVEFIILECNETLQDSQLM